VVKVAYPISLRTTHELSIFLMATPLGHSLAGYAISSFFSPAKQRSRVLLIFLPIIMANLPDLDFLPGILKGAPALYHQGIAHSLGVALMVSLAVAVFYRVNGFSARSMFILCFTCYASHLILDFFGPDDRPPYGIPLFWPVVDRSFISPIPILIGVHHAGTTNASIREWIQGILTVHNLGAMIVEVLLIGPFLLLSRLLPNKKE
jgi:inner membrane protein